MIVLCRVHCFLQPTKARLRHIIIDTSPLACYIGVTTCTNVVSRPSDLSSRLSLRSVHEAIGFAPNCFVLCRHPDPDCKGVFHRVVYNSISAQYPTQYANLAFPFSRLTCCSTVAPSMARSANPAAALLHHRWRATLFHPKATLRSSSRRGSHRNDSASNSTQYSNEYPNLALSSSSLKLQTML